ncbi:hypothetical protein QUB80_14200 [Chlorogloeopsis sp. ULAP01]|nr:hypothetical protein [Chlorogloeopsis sp. ULAP01]MDM9381852.1 hypothetical protein [Chlorogloeopsis sp. ULAP01]
MKFILISKSAIAHIIASSEVRRRDGKPGKARLKKSLANATPDGEHARA